MNKNFVRKEVHLNKTVVSRLKKMAIEKKWSLKQFMEDVLIEKSFINIQLPDKNNTHE